MTSLLVRGMHGLGDNVHQRAIIRALLKRDYQIALETSWPCVYHDLPIRFIRRPVALRTQLKNAIREIDKFSAAVPAHHGGRSIHISYNRGTISGLPSGTVLEAMFASAGIQPDYAEADYSLPIPVSWVTDAYAFSSKWTGTKPVMIYRPLVARPEFRGSGIRNANPDQYAELITMVRDSFFVV